MKKKELHIIQVITKLELGGAQKVCLSLFNGLVDSSTKTTLISAIDGQLVEDVQGQENVILMPELLREVSIKTLFNELKAFSKLVKILRSIKKKSIHVVVHTHSTKAGILGRWAAFFAGIQHRVHTVHGYALHHYQSWFSWLSVYLIELITSLITTHYICVSSEDVKTGMRLFPRFSNKHSIIRAAVDTEQFFIPAKKTIWVQQPEKPFVFGTVSCFKKQKNLIDLLKAFASVYEKNNNTRLEIIGDGILRPQLESWIKEHNLNNAVVLHGWKHNVAEYMQTWNVFVLSSLWEGLPCAIVEARLTQLPVVAYNTGGIHDVIFHNENGLLVQQKAWQELASHMHTLTKNSKLYNKLRTYNDDLEMFSYSHMIKQHKQLYQKML